ncbi:sodium-dependent bicarbonate transport family permease [Ancylobacter radicis]|uniref:Sodium-dependent bicarbonate transport family permease n=1 Tax=Ancylobacter radicis TaxID=2836179 RepID=A0ABS5RBC1_9HYPH|nr:sodium-dependent bicarbonate transport family permease [Ancylobacter radicis]MBS9477642.1 sodium-dependent bicarbonate transport family permease [Ancylobacter radicis]
MSIASAALLSPPVLCFGLGALACALRSNLRVPAPVFEAVSIYLLLAIGLKGGAELAETRWADIAAPAGAALALGMLIPVWCFLALRRIAGFSVADAASLAAHYGSVSAVTFIAVISYLERAGVPHEGFMTAILALMEAPAIVVALLLARMAQNRAGPTAEDAPAPTSLGEALREVVSAKSFLLLVGGLVIGGLIGKVGLAPVRPFFGDLFLGFLCLFLLELGIVAAEKADAAWQAGGRLLAFALLAPLVNGALGLLAGHAAGLSEGGAVVLATLAASASYIAAPAAVRLALPQANAAYSLAASLAITFPFNVVIGIPLYAAAAGLLYR